MMPPLLLSSSANFAVTRSQPGVSEASGPVIEIVVPMTIGSSQEFCLACAAGAASAEAQAAAT